MSSHAFHSHGQNNAEESIVDNLLVPLNPLVAIGSFFTNRSSLSLSDHPSKADPTIQYLYTSTIFEHQLRTINKDIPLAFTDFQLVKYETLLTLTSSLNQPHLGEAVNDVKSRALTIKRKYEELFTSESSSNMSVTPLATSTATTATTTTTEIDSNDSIEDAMEWSLFCSNRMNQCR